MLRSVRYSFMMSGEGTKVECVHLSWARPAARVVLPRSESRTSTASVSERGRSTLFDVVTPMSPIVERSQIHAESVVSLCPTFQVTMDDWFTKLSLSDNLDTDRSGVFKVAEKGWVHEYYWCQLCSRQDGSQARIQRESIEAHLLDPLHKNRAKDLLLQREEALQRFDWSLQLSQDVIRYRCPTLESMICRYILLGGTFGKHFIMKRQQKLKLADPMVHLELALWKAACERSPPGSLVHPWEWKAWYCSGWKQLKPSMRRDPLTCITGLVAPFLGLKRDKGENDGSLSLPLLWRARARKKKGRKPSSRLVSPSINS
jgi:hypothetical protein